MAAQVIDAPARPRFRSLAVVGAGCAVAAGVALRLGTTSDLWLDEALSVSIAKLPVGDLIDALERDGHPPLYYLILHMWMKVLGGGDEAARSLSAVFSVATIPLLWVAAREYGGRSAAVAATVILATNPFAIRYATEARMYSLVTLLVVIGWLAVRSSMRRPSRSSFALVAITVGLLLLTHYWSFYLVAATAAVLAWLWRRGRSQARRTLVALSVGCVLFAVWVPVFLAQAGSTGTPWGRPQRPTSVVTISLTDWGGGTLNGLNSEAQLLGGFLAVLALLALFARSSGDRRVELDLRTTPHVRPEVVVVGLTVGLAVVASYATSSAFASRYTAGVFPLALLVVAYGVASLPGATTRAIVVSVLAALGLVGGIDNLRTQRTQGGEIARYISANGRAGDVVAYCPDQLGPAVARLLPLGFRQVTYPEGASPDFVDWTEYSERLRASDPVSFAAMLDQQAGGATLWLVWSGGYRGLGRRCETLSDELRRHRPGGTAVLASGDEFEHGWLFQYGPGR